MLRDGVRQTIAVTRAGQVATIRLQAANDAGNLDDIRSECITITFADEGAPKVETISPEEMANRGMATNWDQVAEQVATLQKKLDDMGPVNHASIEEYEEAESRHAFLSKQHEDLDRRRYLRAGPLSQ